MQADGCKLGLVIDPEGTRSLTAITGTNGGNWSGREDSNLRPLAPHASALPGCATSRPDESAVRGFKKRRASYSKTAVGCRADRLKWGDIKRAGRGAPAFAYGATLTDFSAAEF